MPNTSRETTKKTAFLVAGRTGGPLMPVLAISKQLENTLPIIIGIKGGFEDRVAEEQEMRIEHLPEAKFTIFSFTNNDWYDWIKEIALTIWNAFLLIFSVFKSIFLLLKYKPQLIITAGGFVAVPLVWASKVTNLIQQTDVKIVMHQQDPQPGLSNKLVSKLADIKTCVFEYTKQKYPSFADCEIIPNPVDGSQYSSENLKNIWLNLPFWQPQLHTFLKSIDEKKPLMLLFGGGGGAWAVNRWMAENAEEILRYFYVIHLTGALQHDEFNNVTEPGYLQLTGLWKEMPLVMNMADLVVCRAGMGSIGELRYLQKPGFLIPLPHSHQQQNAELVQDEFVMLPQQIIKKRAGKENWLQEILHNYPAAFKQKKYTSKANIEKSLNEYYEKINEL